MKIDLAGKAIAITGASSGIGAATARACAAAGMPVALMARREDRLMRLAGEIRSAGGRAETVVGDVTEESACRSLVDRCVAAFGGVYAVFGNAGYGAEVPTLSMSEADIRRMFDVNFFGSLNVLRPAVEAMRAAAGRGRGPAGHVLLCSSCLSKLGLPRYAAYCATKAAQDHFGRAMRHELRSAGVAVSTVHPIGTRTEFFEQAERESGGLTLMDRRTERGMQPPSRVADAIVRRLRSGRGGEVWTAPLTRAALGLSVAMPGLTDLALRLMYGRRTGRRGG